MKIVNTATASWRISKSGNVHIDVPEGVVSIPPAMVGMCGSDDIEYDETQGFDGPNNRKYFVGKSKGLSMKKTVATAF